MTLPFTFPAPLEAFIDYQEQLTGRSLSQVEREVTETWLPVINEAGTESIQALDELIAQHSGDEWITRFLAAAKTWMVVAHERRNH